MVQPAPPPRTPRGGVLDALRFLAALFVVLFHFGDVAPTALRSLHPFLERGYLATDFFLILSGFVLARAYGHGVLSGRIGFGRFWTKRFARCYPTHLITLGLLAAMVGLGALIGLSPSDPQRYAWSDLPAQVLLLHAFGAGGGQWNIPSWTISTLLICYAAFPLLWRAMTHVRSLTGAVAVALGVMFGSETLALSLLGQDQFNLGMEWCLFRAAPLFIVGLAIARGVELGRWTGARARAVAVAGGGVLLVNAVLAGPDMLNLVAISTLILGCGASPVTRPLPGAEWGARVSFSLFMIHTLTGAVWFAGLGPLVSHLAPSAALAITVGWGLWLLALPVTVVAAGLYDRWVDAPIQKALTNRFFSRMETLPGDTPREAPVTPRPDPRPEPAPNG